MNNAQIAEKYPMTDRQKTRKVLKRWGSVDRLCSEIDRDIDTFRLKIEAARSVNPTHISDMPRSGKIADPTAVAALNVLELTKQYEIVVHELLQSRDEQLRFMRAIDALIELLPDIEQQVIRLRYKRNTPWFMLSMQLYCSERYARKCEGLAIDFLSELIV